MSPLHFAHHSVASPSIVVVVLVVAVVVILVMQEEGDWMGEAGSVEKSRVA